MANLQQVGVELLGQHLPFTGRLGIAFEQHGGLPVGYVEHQRIVIAGGRACHVIDGRGQHIHLRAAEGKAAPGSHRFHRNVEPGGFGQECLVGRDLRIGPHPQHPGTKITQNRRHSPHVIAVCVGESHGVETADIA